MSRRALQNLLNLLTRFVGTPRLQPQLVHDLDLSPVDQRLKNLVQPTVYAVAVVVSYRSVHDQVPPLWNLRRESPPKEAPHLFIVEGDKRSHGNALNQAIVGEHRDLTVDGGANHPGRACPYRGGNTTSTSISCVRR